MKENEDTDEIYIMFMDWKIRYCQNQYTPQGNLLIQCNLNPTSNGIFHRSKRNKVPEFVWRQRRSQIAKVILRKKNRAKGIRLPDFRLYYKLQSSKQYGTRTKIEI